MKSYGVTIQMKATEQYFPAILFIMLYEVVQMKPFWQSLSMVLFMCLGFTKMNFIYFVNFFGHYPD